MIWKRNKDKDLKMPLSGDEKYQAEFGEEWGSFKESKGNKNNRNENPGSHESLELENDIW
ncbi:hypothetical protein [Jeotgalibacillus proteolyticus]|uniref:Uncharacterized protein n=1 Tax=Jeotgalibacillus proteolyticus TaxID=2082395 RepID=A0A2S5GD22_9BACL|nr:hypothetical protein [Jeotgalibacillus proteolyticus]PPA70804.1 hypothetical protein C4B60_08405 [Jeotgalibacillus proteolyticus]